MSRCLIHLSALMLLLGLSGCSGVPAVSVPGPTHWFADKSMLEVAEVARGGQCRDVVSQAAIMILPNLATTQRWAAERGITIKRGKNQDLLDAPYAVILLGHKQTGGYGVAVSRQAQLKNDVVQLNATFFDPAPGRWSGSDPTNPCAIVSLPPRQYAGAELYDQSGTLRAASAR
ncbi:MAG: protease complex subunit PrcB family protein [Panacagrimonas sp.]